MSFKIPCGGFKLDEKSFSLDENGVLSVSGGGGGVQSNYNQNDSTAADYIKNRPFYTGDPVETVLVEESTVSFSGSGGMYSAQTQSNFEATVGDTYKVSWDGAAYECVCVDFRNSLFIGNLSIADAGSDTGEPFLMQINNGSGIVIYTKDASASHTFSISGSIAEVIQIPDKYIPNTFRDVVIAGNPLNWSEDDWAKYYGLFQSGKLLMINGIGRSHSEGYVLSMSYVSHGAHNISAIDSIGNFYSFGVNHDSGEDNFYWVPIISYNAFYFQYQQTGSDISTVNREEYERLEILDGLTFTRKKANENEVSRNVVLEGDKEIILSSSTSGSAKKFKITVDDSGTIKATEVT